jgi:hypothetical protein
LFINIDEKIPKEEWNRWIGNLSVEFPEIKIGVLSSSNDEKQREQFINHKHVKCGYFIQKPDMTNAIDKMLEILHVLNVKGRRKYLRAATERETNTTVNMPHMGEFIKGTVNDVSVVGFSCVFEHDPDLKKNALVKDIQIKLQAMLIKAEAVVYGSRVNIGEKIYVFIFTHKVEQEEKIKIRKYIQHNLQSKMDLEINH